MKINVEVPASTSGDWSVEDFTVSREDAELFNVRANFQPGRRSIEAGDYKKLVYKNDIIMSNTPAETRDCMYFIRIAVGNILINGLGLGIVVAALLKKPSVLSIIVIENSDDVIKLVAPSFKDKRVKIIHMCAFDYAPPRGIKYDYVWHDIWTNICTDNLREMHKLHRKYGKRSKWQGSWCRELCESYKSYNR